MTKKTMPLTNKTLDHEYREQLQTELHERIALFGALALVCGVIISLNVFVGENF